MDITTFAAYLAAIAVVLIPPDGNAVLVAGAHAARGWRGTAAFTAGDLTANLLQMTVSATALAAVMAAAPALENWLRWVGAGVLLVLALAELVRRPARGADGSVQAPRASRFWVRGFLASAVNPVALVFYAALLPAFIDPEQPLVWQLIILALGWVVVDGLLLLLYGVFGGYALTKLSRRWPLAPRYANAGGLFIAAAVIALVAPGL